MAPNKTPLGVPTTDFRLPRVATSEGGNIRGWQHLTSDGGNIRGWQHPTSEGGNIRLMRVATSKGAHFKAGTVYFSNQLKYQVLHVNC
jgi:hypothetical protein